MSKYSSIIKGYIISGIVLLIFSAVYIEAAPSPELPGEEISESAIIKGKSPVQEKKNLEVKKQNRRNWKSPSIDQQLSRDKTLIPMGHGALFVPSYTEPRLEPDIIIYKTANNILKTGKPGQRILMEKGSYKVRVGSGSFNRMIERSVTITEGHTSLLQPNWSGLVIETISPDDEYLQEEYEIYRLENSIPYGKGYGLEEERLKDIKTWILKPGLYRISKVGEDFTSRENYITVQLNRGKLTELELIFRENEISNEMELISGGIKQLRTKKTAGSNWRYGLRLGGNVNLFFVLLDEEETTRDLSALTDLKARATYDNIKYLGINVLQAKNKFNKEKGEPFEPQLDDVQIRSTWVRRLNDYIGPYVRGTIKSNIFSKDFKAGETGAIVYDENNSRIDSLAPREKFELYSSASPVKFGEGVGLNIQIFNFYSVELSTLVGAAFKQDIYRDDYWTINTEGTELEQQVTALEYGVENTVSAKIRFLSFFSVDFRSDIFLREGYIDQREIEDFTVDFRLNLTRHVEISYIYEMNDIDPSLGEQFEHTNNILLRVTLNY